MKAREVTLQSVLGRQDLTMEELVETADTLVRRLAPRQTKYKVTERPDARTIRYYVTQGLLPRPVGYEGGRARYAGSHLLRLIWIKRLQAEHHTLQRIARMLEGKSDADVLRALDREEPDPAPEEKVQAPSPPPEQARSAAPSKSAVESLEITDTVLRDPEKRKKLAETLEQLAAWLRKTGDE